MSDLRCDTRRILFAGCCAICLMKSKAYESFFWKAHPKLSLPIKLLPLESHSSDTCDGAHAFSSQTIISFFLSFGEPVIGPSYPAVFSIAERAMHSKCQAGPITWNHGCRVRVICIQPQRPRLGRRRGSVRSVRRRSLCAWLRSATAPAEESESESALAHSQPIWTFPVLAPHLCNSLCW